MDKQARKSMDNKNVDNHLNNIVGLLKQCDMSTLRTVRVTLEDLIWDLQKTIETDKEKRGRSNRGQGRYKTNLPGTLLRVTDLRPGEKKEYNVKILDLSREGMRLRVDTDFIPSRIIEMTFAKPGGNITQCSLEVVRMRKRSDDQGDWLDVGCRVIDDSDVRLARIQEKQITRLRSKIYRRKQIKILIVGSHTEETDHLSNCITNDKYQIRNVPTLDSALTAVTEDSFDLVVFIQGNDFFKDQHVLDSVTEHMGDLAKLALMNREGDFTRLYKAGIDECFVKADNAKALLHAIERVLLGHLARVSEQLLALPRKALLVATDTTTISLLVYRLEQYGYAAKLVKGTENISPDQPRDFSIVLIEFDPDDLLAYRNACQSFDGLPVIALCHRATQGHVALANGANDYLSLPPKEDDFRMIMENCLERV